MSPRLRRVRRIGLAGFHDDPNGMTVTIDIGTLAPGVYSVGIADPSVLVGRNPSAASAACAGRTAGTRNWSRNAVCRSSRRTEQRASTNSVHESRQQSIETNSVGAQAGEGGPQALNPASASPVSAPGGSPANPTEATTGGQPANRPANEQRNGARANVGTAGVPMWLAIGTLTVDQSGTGRMEQLAEGMQVRSVVGEAIVICSQPKASNRSLPPDLDLSVSSAPAEKTGASTPTCLQLIRPHRYKLAEKLKRQ